jgi:hypothetical protein
LLVPRLTLMPMLIASLLLPLLFTPLPAVLLLLLLLSLLWLLPLLMFPVVEGEVGEQGATEKEEEEEAPVMSGAPQPVGPKTDGSVDASAKLASWAEPRPGPGPSEGASAIAASLSAEPIKRDRSAVKACLWTRGWPNVAGDTPSESPWAIREQLASESGDGVGGASG